MLRAPVPDRAYPDIYAITPAFIRGRGIRLLLLDLDNTLLPYEIDEPTPRLRNWILRMRAAGAEPVIFSNNRGGRPAIVAEKLGVGFIGRAKKPNPRKLVSLLRKKGIAKGAAALIGDQIYTDIFCARRAGVLALAVRPIDASKPHRALRYAAELPFRLIARLREANRNRGRK